MSKGNSKYAEKVRRRKKEARALGLDSGTPYPVIREKRREKGHVS